MADTPTRWLTRAMQARRYSVSVRTIERWGEDPALGMPPEMEVNGRFLRNETKLDSWDRSRVLTANRAARKRAERDAHESA
jgi:hypothetical protein